MSHSDPIDRLDDETCEEIAEILHGKYSMFAGTHPDGGEQEFNVSRETMKAIVLDTWLITSGVVPLEQWRD